MEALGYIKCPPNLDVHQSVWDVAFNNAIRGNTLTPLRAEYFEDPNRYTLQKIKEKAFPLAVRGAKSMQNAADRRGISSCGSAVELIEYAEERKGIYP